MLVLISIPNAPSVKYNGFIYPNEAECQMARYELLEVYDARPEDYKKGLKQMRSALMNPTPKDMSTDHI